MVNRSKRIKLLNRDKINNIDKETLKLWRRYKSDMEIRGLSEKTIKGYESDLMQWFIYILDEQYNASITTLTEDDITEFISFTKHEGNNNERIKRRMSSISAFYKYLRKKKLVSDNPVEYMDRPKKGLPIVTQTYLTSSQVSEMKQKLLENDNLQLLTYALFSLSTMARVNAVAHLRWEQIDFENRVCEKVLEKEQRYVDLFFSEEVKEILSNLKQFRTENNLNDYGWVFVTPYVTDSITPISNSTLGAWCKQIGDMISVSTLHPHDFRHSGATLLKNNGMALEDISYLLNHESTDVTKKYYIKENKQRIGSNKDKYGI